MYAPAYAGAAVAEAKAKAKASMAKYLASLVKREEEGWTVLAAEVRQAPDERFFSSADELEQTPLIPAARQRMSRWKMQPLGWRRCRRP